MRVIVTYTVHMDPVTVVTVAMALLIIDLITGQDMAEDMVAMVVTVATVV
jgi:hypothetical protein